MDSLFDQSKLIALAERLIKAARAAGADSADAVAMRSVSQSVDVRDGAIEESQRSEGDDMGLRVFIGRKQAVVSTNDMSGDGVAALAERAVAMACVAPEDKYAGLADPALLAKNFPDLDLVDPGWCARQRAGLGLPLAEVAPVGMAVAVAETPGLGHDEDDAGEGHRAERRNSGWGGHRR